MLDDLNTTPWSPAFKELLYATGLRDSRPGFGLQGTWPTWFPPFLMPIDHVLVSDRFDVRQHQLGPHFGSDHLPVLVEVALLKAPELPAPLPGTEGFAPGQPNDALPETTAP